jgi:hypothetical protein
MRALINQRVCGYCKITKDMSEFASRLDYACRECLPAYQTDRFRELSKARFHNPKLWTRRRVHLSKRFPLATIPE